MSSRSFISFDQAIADLEDDVRAQVIVKTGSLPITKVVDGDRGVARVYFDHESAGMDFAVVGNVLMDSDAYKAATAAAGTGQEVTYRIETRRKDSVSRRRPFPPVDDNDRKPDIEYLQTQGKGDKNDVIAALVAINDAMSSEAVTNPDEDAKWASRPRTDAPPFIEQRPAAAVSAGAGAPLSAEDALVALSKARRASMPNGVVDVLIADAIKAGATMQQITAAGAEQGKPQPPLQKGFAREGKPYEAYNTDGRPNLGSWQVGRVHFIYSWAHNLLLTQFAESITPYVQVEKALARANKVMALGDQVQVRAYGGGRPDRSAMSHRYATDLVMDEITHRHPFPTSAAEAPAWEEKVVSEAVGVLNAIATITFGTPNETPATSAEAPASAPVATPTEVAEAPEPVVEVAEAPEPVVEVAEAPEPVAEVVETPAADKKALLQQLANLAREAGFDPSESGNPVSVWIKVKFNVDRAGDIPLETLQKIVDWYGQAGAAKFKEHVLDAAGRATTKVAS